MKHKQALALPAIIAVSIVLNISGLKWGIPSSAKAGLVLSPNLRNKSFYDAMTSAREDIYKYSNGSPTGWVGGQIAVTPIMRSMGIKENSNFVFENDERTLANFIRPYLLRTYHMDEQMTIASLARMKPRKFDFNPKSIVYGGAYVYGVGAWLGVLATAHFVELKPDLTFYYNNPDAMGRIFTAGRALNSVFITLSILMVFLISGRFLSKNSSLLASALFGFSPIVMYEAHILKPYCMSAFFALACLYYSLKMLGSPARTKDYALAGIFLGLTTGSMSFFGIVIIAPVIALLTNGKLLTRYTAFFVLSSCLAFVAVNPYWLLDPSNLLFELKAFGHGKTSGSASLFFNYFFHQLPIGISAVTLLLAAAGAVFSGVKRNKELMIIAVTGLLPVFFAAWIIRSPGPAMSESRLLVPWVGMISICAAAFADLMLRGRPITRYAALAAVFIAIIHSLLFSSLYAKIFIRESSEDSLHFAAGKWINDNLPAGSSIGISALPEPTHVPPYDFSRFRTILFVDENGGNAPQYRVFTYNIPENIEVGRKWIVLKEFKPDTSLFGVKLDAYFPGIYSPVTILKRV